ncbi:uncharacterized protein LOC131891196 [Tigriopus californicus]|uniref:uncharacterized protein LOC131891196 n=1 Tax=Tigriopus californicus TaxID=6832 RepID=UPI0027DA7E33|nr:uncharacterized protein LOC131891196 [Tigriopus californicus]
MTIAPSFVGQGAGSEKLGSNIQAELFSPLQISPRQSFGSDLPFKVELKHSDYSHAKWLDIKLPRKTVIKALLVETIKPKYLKSFFLKVAEADFAQPGQLEYIEFQPNMPGLFHVFHTSPENMDEIMSRTIPLIRPRMTRRFQIEIVESAPELAFNLEIIGMSGEKAYAANKYLESDHESNYGRRELDFFCRI